MLEEDEAEKRYFIETKDDVYITPPQSPRELTSNDDPRIHDPILSRTEVSQRRYTASRAQLMLTLHDTIVRDLTKPEAQRLPAAALDAERVQGRRKHVMSYFPGCNGNPGHTVKYGVPKDEAK